MACNLTSGIAIGCRESIGGLKTAWILDASGEAITVTESAGVVSAISVGATSITSGFGEMFEFELVKQTSSLVEAVNASEENGTVFFNSTLSLIFNKLESSKLNALKVLAANSKLAIVVEDNNGTYWMPGNTNGMIVTGGSSESGVAMGDRNGMTIEFQGFHSAPMYAVSL